MSLGRAGRHTWKPEVIAKIPRSLDYIAREMLNTPYLTRKQRLETAFNFPNLTASDAVSVINADDFVTMRNALSNIISANAQIQWATHENTVQHISFVKVSYH